MRVLYIDIDSLRPDHLSCYGYLRQTSPYIDGVAALGVRFTNYYATDTPCLPSRTAFFGGMFGMRTGVVNHGGAYADLPVQGAGRAFRTTFAQNSLATVLRRAGYHTASISPFPQRHTAYQIWYGFAEMHDTGKGGWIMPMRSIPLSSAGCKKTAGETIGFCTSTSGIRTRPTTPRLRLATPLPGSRLRIG